MDGVEFKHCFIRLHIFWFSILIALCIRKEEQHRRQVGDGDVNTHCLYAYGWTRFGRHLFLISNTPRRPPQEEERTGALSLLYTKTIYVIDPPFPCCCFSYLICVSRVFKKKKLLFAGAFVLDSPPLLVSDRLFSLQMKKKKKESCCVMGPSFVVCVGVASCIRLLTDVYMYRLTRWNRWGPSTEMFAQQFGPNNTRDASQRKEKRISHATTDLYLIYFPPRLQEGRPRSFH